MADPAPVKRWRPAGLPARIVELLNLYWTARYNIDTNAPLEKGDLTLAALAPIQLSDWLRQFLKRAQIGHPEFTHLDLQEMVQAECYGPETTRVEILPDMPYLRLWTVEGGWKEPGGA